MCIGAEKIRLIVTADDFGAGLGRNAGIVAAWRDGIVTAVSLLANGPAFDQAVEVARRLSIPVGVHLNLADGLPLNGAIAGLTTNDGRLPGKELSRRAFTSGRLCRSSVQQELNAQIERVLRAGLIPDHIDSHQHAFLFPCITEVVIELSLKFKIPTLRLPLPMEAPEDDPDGILGAELGLYRNLAPTARDALRNAGLHTPAGLFGMPLLNRLDEATLSRLLYSVPSGTWELMCHPGQRDRDNPFGTQEREREVAALTAPTIRKIIRERDIELISYRDLNPSCVF